MSTTKVVFGRLSFVFLVLALGQGCATIEMLEQRAIDGDQDATYRLAVLHLEGDRVPKDEQRAVALLRQASTGGHLGALHTLAWCFDSGTGVAKDSAKAAEHYWASAKAGSIDSLLALADIYMNGREGVPKNLETAVDLLQIAEALLQRRGITTSSSSQAASGSSALVPNAYGLGVHMNRYGQAVRVRPAWGGVPGEMLRIKPDAYGLGVHMDQYGRPVHEMPAFGH
jgi:hypothetical protein